MPEFVKGNRDLGKRALVSRLAVVADAYGLWDVARAIGPLRGVDLAAIRNCADPDGAADAVLVGFRPAGSGINLAFAAVAQAAGFELRFGQAPSDMQARRVTAAEVVAAAIELVAPPTVEGLVLVCPLEHVDVIARRVHALGKHVVVADHPRNVSRLYVRFVDELIELPTVCWPLTTGKAA